MITLPKLTAESVRALFAVGERKGRSLDDVATRIQCGPRKTLAALRQLERRGLVKYQDGWRRTTAGNRAVRTHSAGTPYYESALELHGDCECAWDQMSDLGTLTVASLTKYYGGDFPAGNLLPVLYQLGWVPRASDGFYGKPTRAYDLWAQGAVSQKARMNKGMQVVTRVEIRQALMARNGVALTAEIKRAVSPNHRPALWPALRQLEAEGKIRQLGRDSWELTEVQSVAA